MKTAYWIVTGLLCAVMAFSAFRYLTGAPMMVEKFHHLGYPDYFRRALGVAKALGVLALLMPRVPANLREWAYAGFAFDLIAAVVSHLASGDGAGTSLLPLLVCGPLLFASYHLRQRLGRVTATPTAGDMATYQREAV
jgi:hypothetical protein